LQGICLETGAIITASPATQLLDLWSFLRENLHFTEVQCAFDQSPGPKFSNFGENVSGTRAEYSRFEETAREDYFDLHCVDRRETARLNSKDRVCCRGSARSPET